MKDLKLVLTNPCSRQWDDLHQTGTGRYCDHCEKIIVDLTTKSDVELIQFFKNKGNDVCGRLLFSQLDRKLEQPSSKINWPWLIPLAMGAITITPAQALNLRPVMVQGDQMFALFPAAAKSAGKLPVLKDTIRVRVIDDHSGKPLKEVKIRQKGFENVVAITDSMGSFELSTAERNMAIPYILKLEGYDEMHISLKDNMVVKLTVVQNIRLGGVSTMPLDQEPLCLIYAGEKSCTINVSGLKDISTDWIEKIEVFKDAKITARYGAKGAHGVVLIEIKKAYASKIDFSQKR